MEASDLSAVVVIVAAIVEFVIFVVAMGVGAQRFNFCGTGRGRDTLISRQCTAMYVTIVVEGVNIAPGDVRRVEGGSGEWGQRAWLEVRMVVRNVKSLSLSTGSYCTGKLEESSRQTT